MIWPLSTELNRITFQLSKGRLKYTTCAVSVFPCNITNPKLCINKQGHFRDTADALCSAGMPDGDRFDSRGTLLGPDCATARDIPSSAKAATRTGPDPAILDIRTRRVPCNLASDIRAAWRAHTCVCQRSRIRMQYVVSYLSTTVWERDSALQRTCMLYAAQTVDPLLINPVLIYLFTTYNNKQLKEAENPVQSINA